MIGIVDNDLSTEVGRWILPVAFLWITWIGGNPISGTVEQDNIGTTAVLKTHPDRVLFGFVRLVFLDCVYDVVVPLRSPSLA